MKTSVEASKKTMVDTRASEYGSFFKDNFAHRAFAAIDDAPKLRVPVFDLISDWRAASYAGALPALIPSSIKRFHDAFVNTQSAPSTVLKFSDAIITRLSREVPEVTYDGHLQRTLREKIVQIAAEISDTDKIGPVEMDGDVVWAEFLAMHPFNLGLHATMRLVYLSVYAAYENFIVQLLRIASGDHLRTTDKKFKKVFRQEFGDAIERAWFSDRIVSAKRVRDALIHAGGRVTNNVREARNPVVEHDGALHVFPSHIRELYDILKEPALELMQANCFRKPDAANGSSAASIP